MSDEGTAPAGDQGTADTGGLFDSYLQDVPDIAKEQVTGYLRDAERGVNSKLREAADIQSRFGPYKDIDLSRVQPEQLSQVLDWVSQVGSDPQAYQDWLKNEATEAGLIQAQQEQATEPENADIDAYIQSRIDEALQPFQQQLSQRDEAANQASIENHINTTLANLQKQHGDLTNEEQEALLLLAEGCEGEDYIEQGFAKLQALKGNAQASFVKDKAGQPTPTLPTGGQAAPQKPISFSDANLREQALEMLSQAM